MSTAIAFEISIVLKEEDIKKCLGYNFFQLTFWAKIIYSCKNQAVETCLNPKNLKWEQLLMNIDSRSTVIMVVLKCKYG